MLLSKATYNKYICQKKVKYITVGTVRMSIKSQAQTESLGQPIPRIRKDIDLRPHNKKGLESVLVLKVRLRWVFVACCIYYVNQLLNIQSFS